jgi:rubredoxin
MRWGCLYCGYVYDEAQGCEQDHIAPVTPWEDVPEDWCCPMCGGDKSGFEAVGE